MNTLHHVMAANRKYVNKLARKNRRGGSPQNKAPLRRLAILTCMDSRLVNFLEPAIGINREEAAVIKNAGNSLFDNVDGTLSSLLICIFELGVEEILVIGHDDCGASAAKSCGIKEAMLVRGISPDVLPLLDGDFSEWLDGIDNPAENVMQVVTKIRDNPLIPADVRIHGLIINPVGGQIRIVVNGYAANCNLSAGAAPTPKNT